MGEQTARPAVPAEDDTRGVIQSPVDVRSTALVVLALIAIIGLLYFAKAVFIPITIAIMASYALTPIVDWLKRKARLPKAVGAAITLLIIIGGIGYGISTLQPAALQILDLVPRAATKLNLAMRRTALEPAGAVLKVRQAAAGIEQVAEAATATTATPPHARPAPDARPAPGTPAIDMRDYLVMGTASAISGIGQLIVIIAMLYFLLIAGDNFRRTLVRISGDSLSKKKITVQILDEIDYQIQRYLLVQFATSALLGVATWLTFAAIGLENAVFWGCVGAVLHLIPYVGPTALVFVTTVVAYVQFDDLQPVVLVTCCTLAIIGVIGMLLVPWLTQRIGRLNAVTVFVSLLFWSWLWGIWGLLLGVPIVMAINAVCERVEDLRPISEFLGFPAPPPAREPPPEAATA
jgi:predicted PurR-regulated permease PerM